MAIALWLAISCYRWVYLKWFQASIQDPTDQTLDFQAAVKLPTKGYMHHTRANTGFQMSCSVLSSFSVNDLQLWMYSALSDYRSPSEHFSSILWPLSPGLSPEVYITGFSQESRVYFIFNGSLFAIPGPDKGFVRYLFRKSCGFLFSTHFLYIFILLRYINIIHLNTQ